MGQYEGPEKSDILGEYKCNFIGSISEWAVFGQMA